MILSSNVVSNVSIGETKRLKSPQLVINTNDFKAQDLKDFLRLSEEIERTGRERRSKKRFSTSPYNTMIATMTREEIFESTNIDDDRFLKAMEHETTYDTEKDHAALVNSIENIMKYFDEDVNVNGRDDGLIKARSVKKLTKGKVAKAVALLCNKCYLTPTPVRTSRTKPPEVKSNIQELKKIYESSMETGDSPSPKSMKSKSPKLARKTKVKQMALLLNNKINSMVKSSSPEEAVSADIDSISSPTFTSTPHAKSPKMKTKFPTFVAKLPSPKPSPYFKRKHLPKSMNSISTIDSPLTKRKQLQQQNSKTCLAAEHVFSQLSVKDKALLYNKFITDMSKQNAKFGKHAQVLESNVKEEIQRGEVVFEKQDSVKHLRDSFEAKSAPPTGSQQKIKTSNCNTSLDITPKSKECEDILQSPNASSLLENDAEDLLHVSNLTVVLKPSPKSNTYPKQHTKSPRKKRTVTFLEDISNNKSSSKRTQGMIRSAFCVEPLAPPKKIRRTLHECLAPDMFFQNPQLEKLFYYWLKEKNGVAFDISPVDSKKGAIEIVPKNSRDNALLPQEVDQILEAAIEKLENNEDKPREEPLVLIKNSTERKKAVIEQELPLEVKNDKCNEIETEDSDLGLTAITKTTSEDSPTECIPPDPTNLALKPLRKKKLRRSLSLKHDNNSMLKPNITFSTDSDSDSKTQNKNLLSCTLPKTKKCANYFKKLIFKTLNTSVPAKQPGQLTNEQNVFELDKSLINHLNSPTKIKKAYTLTVMSSPSPHSESDFYDNDLPRTPTKEASKSWPSLLEAGLANDVNLLKGKFVGSKCIDLSKNSQQQCPQKLLIDSYIDQGFETGSNDVESPTRLTRTADQIILENCSSPLERKSVQQEFIAERETAQAHTATPMPHNSPTMPLTKDAFNMSDSTNQHHKPAALHENATFFSQNSPNSQANYHPSGVTYKVDASQFWITAGDFTAAIAIQHYEPERLLILKNIFVKKSLESTQIHFGIDDQKFSLDTESTAAPDGIIKKVPKECNCSQYWFSTGDVLIPFRGNQMTTQKIHNFFRYIREHILESGCLSFGIDSYEFSTIYQQTQNSVSTWVPAVSSIKTSDLDQSDIDSEVYEGSRHCDSVSFGSEDLSNYQLSATPENPHNNAEQSHLTKGQTTSVKQAIPDILNKLQKHQSKLKTLEARILNSSNTAVCKKLVGVAETTEGIDKLGSIITAIDNIGQENGFKTFSLEQLESCMFFVSRYAELCLSNCTANMENIVDVIASEPL